MNTHDRTLQATDKIHNQQQLEGETLKYRINYAPILSGITIVSSSWAGQGVEISGTGTSGLETFASLTASSGRYTVINTITTSAAEVLQNIINLHVASNQTFPQQGDYE